jgi:hypothetical protein
MDANQKPASDPETGQTDRAPIFQVRTGIRAGGLRDWWAARREQRAARRESTSTSGGFSAPEVR